MFQTTLNARYRNTKHSAYFTESNKERNLNFQSALSVQALGNFCL